jgi:hypothetical protein
MFNALGPSVLAPFDRYRIGLVPFESGSALGRQAFTDNVSAFLSAVNNLPVIIFIYAAVMPDFGARHADREAPVT